MNNPILPLEIRAADPHLCRFGDRYWLYATSAGTTEPGFAAWSSPDLVQWRKEGMVLKFAEVGWAKAQDWAPACIERGGKYYFYFSADSRIGVGVASSPAGPFKDPLGKPLVAYKDDISVIDPMPFIDEDGKAYLYWGAVPASWLEGKVALVNTSLSVHRLKPDMITLDGPEIPTIASVAPPGKKYGTHIEAQFVIKRRGVYFLMWSAGNWDASDDANAYRVEYATARSPLGPWKNAPNRVIETNRNAGIIGPGHHSVLQLPGDDKWVICYHAHKGDAVRRVHLDWLTFEGEERIRTVVPTWEGVGRVPTTR